ncbi:Vps51/Vps67-domain-containing protein [Russula earlei]|uniref:Vps51/Vps67-domain-containing protein n=1 Tax=Russula earlei TaxID=71964 RepID=A0ACC0UJK2_9AGAM|nr:Vps51/Vps67-domain-containing protein [Russula earlei]
MSHSDTHSPSLASITPPRPRSSNRTLTSPLRPDSAPQPSTSQRSTTLPNGSPRPVIGSAVSPTPERSKTKAMDLLRKHYGLSVTPPPPSGRPMDPMDFDSPAFDAKAYYDQLITTGSLTTLLRKENDLLTGYERQSLVYNHHRELIDATDTISSMKSRAESLDSDLELLKSAFSEISRLSAEVAIESSPPSS